MVDRLARLYTKVDESETPLPRVWSAKDKYTYIGLSQSNLRVHYKGVQCSNPNPVSTCDPCLQHILSFVYLCYFVCVCVGSGKNHKDAASVRASHPIPAACGVYYFEIRVISKGRDGCVLIRQSLRGKFNLGEVYLGPTAALRPDDVTCRYMGIGLSTCGVNLNRLPGGFAFLTVF